MNPKDPQWGSCALVAYLPDPLGAYLTALRHSMPGERTESHLTFLPPRTLAGPRAAAAAIAGERLGQSAVIEIELSGIEIFPRTNVLYVAIEKGRRELQSLHAALNQGALHANEPFEYWPHITIGGPYSEAEARSLFPRVEESWRAFSHSRCFSVAEVVFLWQPGKLCDREWTRLSTFTLMRSEAFSRNAANRT
jgi:2'-5' RNA ligase